MKITVSKEIMALPFEEAIAYLKTVLPEDVKAEDVYVENGGVLPKKPKTKEGS